MMPFPGFSMEAFRLACRDLAAAGRRFSKAMGELRWPLIQLGRLARGHLRTRRSRGWRRHIRRMKAGRRAA